MAGTVLVAGAAGALGGEVVRTLKAGGWTVVAADLVAPVGAGADQAVALDVSDEGSWAAAIGGIAGLRGLVNAAGIHRPNVAFADLTLADWRQHFAVNADGVFLGCRFGIDAMRATGGAIVNFASGLGIKSRATSTAYCASKAAVLMTTRCAARAGGPHGVRVNAVLPGPIESPMLMDNKADGEDEAAFLARFNAGLPLGRMATPADIAGAVAFLLSDAARAITGVALPVDGGDMPGG